ncbi:MAG: hypothetical protein HYY20_09725, partial [Candidatus Tectomicrobia bacterium]|nr:hypothetical protein [Candidatus Tectomicrobia bacterium]
MKLGAYDYITKPFKMEEILLGVGRALEEGQLRRAVAVGKGPIVQPEDLPEGLTRQRESSDFLETAADKGLTIEDLEREYILKVLEQAGWNKARAAKV